MDIAERLLAAFQDEHKQLLDGLRSVLGAMEAEARSPTEAELEEAFRLAHSLKSGARVCGLSVLETLGQRLESLFSHVKQGAIPLDNEAVRVIHLVAEGIEGWMAARMETEIPADPSEATAAIEALVPSAPQPEPEPEQSKIKNQKSKIDLDSRVLAAFQAEHREHLEGLRGILAAMETGGGAVTTDSWDEAARRAHSLKGGARAAGLRLLETLGHRLEALFDRARDGALSLESEARRVIYQALDFFEDWMAALAEGRPLPEIGETVRRIETVLGMEPEVAEPLPEAPVAAASGPADMLRLSAGQLDRLLQSAGEVLTESLRQDLVGRALDRIGARISETGKECRRARMLTRRATDRPDLARAAEQVELLETRVRALTGQMRAVRLDHQRSSFALGLLAEQLQQDVRRARMVPAETVFQPFRRMVRELAADEGKEIEFHASGFGVQADRMVLQALKDPLMHTLRNAVSHGIEPAEERARQGKGPAGQVLCRIEASGNRLNVVVEDDGRGLDFQRIAEVAVQRKLLSESQAAAAAPDDLIPLLFQPRFSTARMITPLAGRGLGLSVVQEAVARLQGRAELRRRDGAGTALTLSVPLSLATYRLILAACAGQTFAIPFYGVDGLDRIPVENVRTVEGRAVITVDGEPVPLQSLAHLLNVGEPAIQAEGGIVPVVLLRSAKKRLAVAVDHFLGQRDAVLKDLPGPAAKSEKLTGAIITEDGSVALVLNPAELVESYDPTGRAPLLETAETPDEEAAPTVLLVDDSITTRTLEKGILEAQGYEVLVAVDGIEGLSKLRTEKVDLMIVDVRMPRMDGFTMLAEVKKDARLRDIPAILVTSMESEADIERGLGLGAEAYITKRKFDHQELLETIEQLL